MTPDLVGGVWLGFDQPRSIMPGAGGGSLAAPIWAQMMSRWYAGRTPGVWAPPAGLVVAELDRATGQRATAATPADRRYTEYLLDGTAPLEPRTDPWRGRA